MRIIGLFGVMLLATVVCAAETPKLVVGLDCYHNNENPPHYTWEAADMGGYAQFGEVLKGLGASLASVKTRLTPEVLKELSLLIIVDPDTPAETVAPKYLETAEVDALEAWVQAGGVLALLDNDKGNAERVKLNVLAARFGITFNDDTANTGAPDFGPLPDHPFFKGAVKLHVVGMCTLTVTAPAGAVLIVKGQTLMAIAPAGKGAVFAVGDPWVYNEYINHQQNKTAVANIFRALLAAAKPVTPATP